MYPYSCVIPLKTRILPRGEEINMANRGSYVKEGTHTQKRAKFMFMTDGMGVDCESPPATSLTMPMAKTT